MLPLLIAGLILIASCNSKNESTEKVIDDTSQTLTDTSQVIENIPQEVNDTTRADEPKTDNTSATRSETSVKWSKLISGEQSRMENRSMLVINNQTKFDELWAIAFHEGMAPAKPKVDFSKNTVIALFLGEMNSGGHSIEPLSIRSSTGGGYVVAVRHNKPGQNCLRTMAIEYPYFFGLTNKEISDKVDFKISERETKCE